jgi:hypothetical protein
MTAFVADVFPQNGSMAFIYQFSEMLSNYFRRSPYDSQTIIALPFLIA